MDTKKTNPKVRLAKLRDTQRDLLTSLAEHKKKIEVARAELQALNMQIAEAVDEIEVQDFTDTVKKEREEREELIDSLDDLVSETRRELKQNKVSDQNEYLSLTAQQLNIATTENSVSRLYELAKKEDSWSEGEATEFFRIQDAVQTTMQYNLSEGMERAVNQTYEAVKTVRTVRGEDIQENYLRPAEMKTPDKPMDRIVQYKTDDKLVDKLLFTRKKI